MAPAESRPARRGRALACLAALALAGLSAAGCASTPRIDIAREWYDLGNAWLDKGDWKRAGEAYSRSIALDPAFAGASFNLARALAEAGDYDGALRILDGIAKRDPKNVRVLSARAYALYKKGDATAALTAYREVLALDSYAPDAVFNAALLELQADEVDAAIADLERLSTAKPDDGQALLFLGRAYDKRIAKAGGKGDPEDEKAALDAYERAKALSKADPPALQRIAELYEAARRFSDAMDAYDAAVKADAKLAGAWFSLARLRLVVAGDSDQGLAALKGAVDAGFSDKDAAQALLDNPDLPERQKVVDLLKAAGLAE